MIALGTIDFRMPTLSPDRRRRMRTVTLVVMARHPSWQVRHHRGELGGLYELEPGSPDR